MARGFVILGAAFLLVLAPTLGGKHQAGAEELPPAEFERQVRARYSGLEEELRAFMASYLEEEWGLRGNDARAIAGWVASYSLEYGVDPLVQLARILVESRARHYVYVGYGKSRTKRIKRGAAGELGLSQIMPFWAGKEVEGVRITREMLNDPEGNILAGILIYKRYRRISPDYLLALARYNNPRARYPTSYARRVDRFYQKIKRGWEEWLRENPPAQTVVDNEPPAYPLPLLP